MSEARTPLGQPLLVLNKKEVAQRQLETAALLYSSELDEVSIHTLVAAAHEVLANLIKDSGPMPFVRLMTRGLDDQMATEVTARLKRPENFFKHANRDADKSLQFAPALTELMLISAALMFRKLTGFFSPMMEAIFLWWAFENAASLQPSKTRDFWISERARVGPIPRREFIQRCMEEVKKVKEQPPPSPA